MPSESYSRESYTYSLRTSCSIDDIRQPVQQFIELSIRCYDIDVSASQRSTCRVVGTMHGATVIELSGLLIRGGRGHLGIQLIEVVFRGIRQR